MGLVNHSSEFFFKKMSYYDTHWYLENEQILVPACLDPIVQINPQRRVDADPWVKKAIIALKNAAPTLQRGACIILVGHLMQICGARIVNRRKRR
jgi:hypothetical protein